MKTVYLFRGGPASGKGSVVPVFAKGLTKPVVLIEQDKLRWGFHLIGRSWEEVTQEEHRLAHQNTELLYEQYLKNGSYTIVVEGLFTWDDTTSSEGSALALCELAERYKFQVKNIVLKADKEVMWQRNSLRQHVVPRSEFDSLYTGVYRTIDPSELVIDSTDLSVQDTLKKITEALR